MNRLISFYGDDFTGSTDVMEALASHGVETVLFTRIPTVQEFELFKNVPAIGLAGSSRSQTPEWMDANLPDVFRWLKKHDAQFCHYKVCSTFDSSPAIGNIGRATEIGAAIFQQDTVPLIVGAPQLKRYTFAGHLFAGYQGQTYRIDRHPVMSRHPVTPMAEADLTLHLSAQTKIPVGSANNLWPEHGMGLLDVYDEATQLAAGQRLLSLPSRATPFVVGSSGIEYALVKALAAQKSITGTATFPPLGKVAQIIVVSGSVSSTTARQIKAAQAAGFETVPVSAIDLARANNNLAIDAAIQQSMRVLSSGKSPIIHTALGPNTDEGVKLNALPDGRQQIGAALGQILRSLVINTGLTRAVIAGGDTSSHALSSLGLYALTTRYPLAATPGSPLCTGHSADDVFNRIEIAMKGGQVGGDDYFIALRDGLKNH
jgi:3-oxoisoapionate kinase